MTDGRAEIEAWQAQMRDQLDEANRRLLADQVRRFVATHRPAKAEHCHYRVEWSDLHEQYVAVVDEFTSLTSRAETAGEAERGLREQVEGLLVREVFEAAQRRELR